MSQKFWKVSVTYIFMDYDRIEEIRDFWFEDYDDAHECYKHFKAAFKLGNCGTEPTPPELLDLPLPRIYKKGEWYPV